MKTKLLIGLFCLLSPALMAQDIVINSLGGSKTADRYAPLDITLEVSNNGIVPTPKNLGVVFRAWLSQDEILDNLDENFFYTMVDSINANQTLTITPTFSSKSAPGTYYIIIDADPLNRITETDESNNRYIAGGIVITQPDFDFAITKATVQSPVPLHSSFGLDLEVSYTGTTNIVQGLLYTHFFLSEDQIFDNQDIIIDGDANDLNGSGVYKLNENKQGILVPLDVEPGNYYVIVLVDYNTHESGQFEETNENNNTAIVPVTIVENQGIDLATDGLVTSSTSLNQDGERYGTGACDVTNVGTNAVSHFSFTIHYSTDNMLSEDDHAVTAMQKNWQLIKPGETQRCHYSVDISDVVPEGEYFVFVSVNKDNLVPESNHSNNTKIADTKVVISYVSNNYEITSVRLKREVISEEEREIDLVLTFDNKDDQTLVDEVLHVEISKNDGSLHRSYLIDVKLLIFFKGIREIPTTLGVQLPPGRYDIKVTIQDKIFSMPLIVTGLPYAIGGNVISTDGITSVPGRLYLYEKTESSARIYKSDESVIDLFAFRGNPNDYTLYFIPEDEEHVPTVFGKTLTLKPTSFFNVNDNTELTMEVIKLQPLPSGNLSISGRLDFKNTGGRLPTNHTAKGLPNYTVLLLNEAGMPVRKATSNADGYYAFNNLPSGNYQVTIAFFPGGAWQMPEAAPVTLTNQNVQTDLLFNVNSTTIEVMNRIPQELIFNAFNEVQYDDGPINLSAMTNVGLPVTYTSSSPNIATIENGKILIHNIGETDITARQQGNETYGSIEKTLTLFVSKADQQINFNALAEVTHLKDIELPSAASSGLSITYTSSNTAVATIEENVIKIHDVGTSDILAEQNGNEFFEPAENVTRTLVVLSVTDTEQNLASLTVHPNPSNGKIQIKSAKKIRNISIADITGRTNELPMRDDILDLTHLPNGMYLLRFQTETSVTVVKIIKE